MPPPGGAARVAAAGNDLTLLAAALINAPTAAGVPVTPGTLGTTTLSRPGAT